MNWVELTLNHLLIRNQISKQSMISYFFNVGFCGELISLMYVIYMSYLLLQDLQPVSLLEAQVIRVYALIVKQCSSNALCF